MKADISRIIDDVCDFLQHDLSQEKREQLRSHLHIDNFRKNKSVNMETNYNKGNGNFIRKGAVGGWKSYFSQERRKDWQEWIDERTKNTGIHFQVLEE